MQKSAFRERERGNEKKRERERDRKQGILVHVHIVQYRCREVSIDSEGVTSVVCFALQQVIEGASLNLPIDLLRAA